MAVEAIGATGSSTSTGRTELQRAQQKLMTDLAARAAEKVAAADKAAITKTETDALQQRQAAGGTVDVGRIGTAVDLHI
jgi:hypothetical protein